MIFYLNFNYLILVFQYFPINQKFWITNFKLLNLFILDPYGLHFLPIKNRKIVDIKCFFSLH